MKKHILFVAICLGSTFSTFAQWNSTGNNQASGDLLIGSIQKKETKLTLNALDNEGGTSYLTFDFNKSSSGLRSVRVGDIANVFAIYTTDIGGLKQDRIYIARDGNVGIGSNLWHPKVKLDVDGDIRGNSLSLKTTETINGWGNTHIYYPGHSFVIGSPEGIYGHNALEIKPGGSASGSLYSFFAMYTASGVGTNDQKVLIHTQGNTFFTGGNVGIGTNSPKKLLDVRGTIHAQNVEVDLNGWSDFVFDKDYKLPTLQEVEAHINEYNRLPDIPSEKQVKEEGINIGEMQAKLLQKIEELTLYVINQNKKIEEQNQEIETLKSILSVQ